MPLSANLLLAAAALCCFATVFAFPMEEITEDDQCRCLVTTDTYINPRLYQRIEIIPVGPSCRHTEIIITLKNTNKVVCVDPEALWVQQFLNRVIRKGP
ncbi:interleukin-8-like [Clarias gariepinus]|uniref:interleukin-8-like n=1 Tax=Clarias gariepinus TaxID=13013 RepID=UPI00234CC2A4|nr:interleukin-8-like [Clarias gariepinus]